MAGKVTFAKHDRVIIEYGGEQFIATVLLASPNSVSLMLSFEAIIAGHVGMMPVLLGDDHVYRSVMTGDEIKLRKWQ